MDISCPFWTRSISTASLCSLSIVCAVSASQSRIVGQVVEDSTSRPVSAVYLLLRGHGSAVAANAVSDSLGRFRLTVPPGTYSLQSSRIGFEQRDSIILVLSPSESRQVLVRVHRMPVALDSINVVSASASARAGFERRRLLGQGIFLDADSIALREPRQIVEAFRGVDGVMLRGPPRAMEAIPMSGDQCIAVFVNDNETPFAVWGRNASGRVALGGGALDAVFSVSTIRGIEIYATYWDIPKELVSAAKLAEYYPCGMAQIWTDQVWKQPAIVPDS